MRKRFRLLLYIGLIVGVVSASIAARPLEVLASPDHIRKDNAASSQEQLAYSLGVQAYIYGYPLVVMEQTKQMALKTRAPLNQFYYSSMLASPQYHDIVTPNSNTLYFSAWLDISKGRVVLNVPANTDDRYYTVQMLDAYTNTFRNVSNRTTGNKAGQFTIVGPGEGSDVTKTSIHAPTPTVIGAQTGIGNDQNAEKLHGTQRYVLHFNKNDLPQVTGFWSLTLYGSDFYLIDNEIGRYSIGDLTKGLVYNADGSLDIYIQPSAPEGKESNWLPTPSGEFNLVLRMFAPKPSMLEGGYEVPPVARIQ
ncbi:DUF1214 domain-containing protein [Paenibacillus xylanivorans]|uniref:DUF1214 domain-containing protein n=1 Tax=Paenibacillus xylanivorans TaxID=1705561 RepID=UPI0006B2051D|nr:DUF1214 domain-containing protein [Paenibacillus xylanivorans]